MNRLLMATIGGVVAGVIGAALWAGVAYGLDREMGILAWGLGALVGAGVAAGAKGEVGLHTGILAAVLSIAAICAGKFAVANAVVDDGVNGAVTEAMDHFGEEQAKVYLADQLVDQQQSDGKKLDWPAEMDAESATELVDYHHERPRECEIKHRRSS
ncbi:MAG: hypothetical protein NTV94_18025 [Planctomycetota bacterium]|nr:hypothetical protein [Planctomycetota bacterium]